MSRSQSSWPRSDFATPRGHRRSTRTLYPSGWSLRCRRTAAMPFVSSIVVVSSSPMRPRYSPQVSAGEGRGPSGRGVGSGCGSRVVRRHRTVWSRARRLAPVWKSSSTQGGDDVDLAPIIEKLNTGLFINGQWRDAEGGRTLEVRNPANGSVLTTIADGSEADALDAIHAARDAQAGWAATPPRERAEILRRAFDLLHE